MPFPEGSMLASLRKNSAVSIRKNIGQDWNSIVVTAISMNLSDQAKRAYSQLPRMVSRIRQSIKSPGTFHFSSGIRSSLTEMQPNYRKSPVHRLGFRGGQVVLLPAPVVSVDPQWQVKDGQDRHTANGDSSAPRSHEEEWQPLAADMPDQSGNKSVGDYRDENVAQRDAIVLRAASGFCSGCWLSGHDKQPPGGSPDKITRPTWISAS